MEHASFTGFLETVLIILLVYFAFKVIVRWFGPVLLKYFMSKIGKRFEEQFRQTGYPFSSNKTEAEGEVSIDKKPQKKQKTDKKVGEYIDYEEID